MTARYPVSRRDDLRVDLGGWLPSALTAQPRWAAAIEAFATELQAIEDAAFLVLIDTGIRNATDAQLDRLGELVREPRKGAEDAVYRRFIEARVRTAYTSGNRSTVGTLLATLTDGYGVALRDAYPAAVFGVADVPGVFTVSLAGRIGDAVREALQAGVGGDFVARPPGGFTFSGASPSGVIVSVPALSGPGLGQVLG